MSKRLDAAEAKLVPWAGERDALAKRMSGLERNFRARHMPGRQTHTAKRHGKQAQNRQQPNAVPNGCRALPQQKSQEHRGKQHAP